VLTGLGLGAASVSATTLGASAVDEADRGTTAGLLNTAAQVGTAVGVAALVLLAGESHRLGFAAAAGAAAVGAAALGLTTPRPGRRRATAPR
jgi:MFS family permease